MEYNPFDTSSGSESGLKPPENGDKDKDKDKSKKDSKKSKAIGSLAFEHEASSDSAKDGIDKSKRSLFDLLSSSQDEKDEKTSPSESVSDEAETPEKRNETTDAREAQGETPELTAMDRQTAAQQIAEARLAEISAEPVAGETVGEAALVQDFYERIIQDAATPEESAAETMDNVAAEGSDETSRDTPQEEGDSEPPTNDTPEEEGDSEPPTTEPPQGQSRPRAASQPPRAPNPGSETNRPHQPTPDMDPSHEPTAAQQPTPRTEYVPYIDRSRAFSDMMVGGIVGYLIGRRAGRIKTERKLIPVQKKLEREVTNLTRTIATQEFAIRESARKQVREQATKLQASEVIIPLRTSRGTELPKRDTRERAERVTGSSRSLSSPERKSERQSEQVLIVPSEHIGKVVIAAESAQLRESQDKKETIKTTDERTVQNRVETLSRNDLLQLSEKINVEGSTLRQVYETHLVSERGLRRLVAEYLRGGDVVRAFKRELIDRQMDFERDPKLRDAIRKNMQGGGGKSPTLQKLLAQAGVFTDDDTLSASKSKASDKRAAELASKRRNKQKAADASLITIIAVLLAVIIVLALRRM